MVGKVGVRILKPIDVVVILVAVSHRWYCLLSWVSSKCWVVVERSSCSEMELCVFSIAGSADRRK